MIRERRVEATSGYAALIGFLALMIGGVALLIVAAKAKVGLGVLLGVLTIVLAALGLAGLFMVNPNEGRVLQLFGDYRGTVTAPGLRWANPFYSKHAISQRVRNFESGKLKVNDQDGNPIEIAAVVVWRVVDTAQAMFDVENFTQYVQIQAEAAVRNLAMHHPYDSHDDHTVSLRGQSDVVAAQLVKEINERVKAAGVEVIDARLAHLAYAPEIAQAMLQRQQAGAIIAARQRIVEGAVSMVEMALDSLAKRGIVELDAERKAAMVSNLLVVLCGERSTQPVVNAGTLY